MLYLRGRHVATMLGPVINDGCIVVDEGRIVAVGRTRDLNPPRLDHDTDGLLMPGLINAHTHLELSHRTPGEPSGGGLGPWLANMIRTAGTEAGRGQTLAAAAVEHGIAQCLRFGVTTVGDISRLSEFTRPILRRSPLRVVSFGEVTAMGERRGRLHARVAAAIDPTAASDRLHVAITPHAPYSVEMNAYRYCLAVAREKGLPLATHLAEAFDEATFIAEHGGSLRAVWDILGGLDAAVPKFSGGPIRLAQSIGLLDYPSLLAHVNYCDDAELRLLAAGRAAVVWCPRTHAYFGHPPHRWRDMRAAGITVCVGTDSCASSPDLNIVDDLRLLRRAHPDESPADLWAMVTTLAADALRWHSGDAPIGRLAVGSPADLIAWETRSDDPLGEILDSPRMLPAAMWISGIAAPKSSPPPLAGGGGGRGSSAHSAS